MSYISRHSGKEINEVDHVRESIIDILSTRKKSRVMLMEYGSDIWELIDRPISRELIADLKMAIATAIDRWENRVKVGQVVINLENIDKGILLTDLTLTYLPTDQVLKFKEVPLQYKGIE